MSDKQALNRNACVHWYFKVVAKVFDSWALYGTEKNGKFLKKKKAAKVYQQKLYAKVFFSWKHLKALQKASYIPLRISTKTYLTKKEGFLQEKNMIDIKIIRY